MQIHRPFAPACTAAIVALYAAGCGPAGGRDGAPSKNRVRPAPQAGASDRVPADFDVTRLTRDALVVKTEPFAANSLVVRTANGTVVLVDTPMTPADTAALLELVRERWGAVPSYAIASHWHADASGGNQVLVDAGIELVSSALTASLLAERGAAMRDHLVAMFRERDPQTARELAALRPTPAPRPIEIGHRTTLVLGGERVDLVYPGPSHSVDSIGVWFPDRRLLYGGCAVRSDGRISNRAESNADGWVRALEVFAALDPELVVPGHGPRFDPEMIAESIAAARGL